MAYQTVFKRYELKYILDSKQKAAVLSAMLPYMELDNYGRTTIRNIYFDTDNYRLIRRSIDKPTYKEKLRVRSYDRASPDSTVFVELKKKYKSVVYKRRISLPERSAMDWVCGNGECGKNTQIAAEIDYFLSFYKTLQPKVFLSYEREAFYALDKSDFRVTFDENILCRQTDLSLCSEVYGNEILPSGKTLMEIKCSGGIPLWMTSVLTRENIYKTSFSKYGTAYADLILPKLNKYNNYEQPKEAAFYA
ncbi:MAG: polyphosphate polymerase domain-containing protein [Acutalibacteraceae bacterium]